MYSVNEIDNIQISLPTNLPVEWEKCGLIWFFVFGHSFEWNYIEIIENDKKASSFYRRTDTHT